MSSLSLCVFWWLFLNVTLAANLILLANNLSLNPGPASVPPYSVKGFRIYHLNIHSLRNNMDELQLFCNVHISTTFFFKRNMA